MRALVVAGAVDPSLDLDIVVAPDIEAALAGLGEGSAFDVVLLGAEAAAGRTLDAIAAFSTRAPEVPFVMIPRRESEYLRMAIEMATRNPSRAAANARRVSALLPRYLERRAKDVAALEGALVREDFEAIARVGHNLRGNGVSFAFPELSAVGEAIEAAAGARNGDGVRDGIARLAACVR